MVQYLVTYSIMTGHESDHDSWLRDTGMPFFQKQAGFQNIKAYSTLVGSGPDWVLEIEFDSPENLMKALDSDESKRLLEDFEHLVTNLSTKILVPMQVPAMAGR
ncbi:MAG: hypothetical protein ACYC5J_09155 [Chloroflexota bacterium]